MQGKLNTRLMFSLALCAACVGCSSESADWCYVTKTSCTLEDGSEMNNGEGYCKDSSTYTKCTNGRLIDDNCDTGACRADGCLVSPVQCTKDGTEYAPGTGYCDADGKSVICGTDGKWGTPEVCPSNQVCSKDGCRDPKTCNGTIPHGDKSCIENTKIYVCEDGTLKPEATDANGDAVSCPRNHVCYPDPNEENSEIACRQVECRPNALACAGEQFQLCGDDEKWGDPKDMPEGFKCKDGDDEVPTCASDSLTTSYCDDYVAMNCALYKEGHVEWSKCGDGFICDKDATSSTYHTCIPETCNANEKDHVRCKLDTYQICDGTSWSVPATIPKSVVVSCKQDDGPNEPGLIQCKEEGFYQDRYCGDSHVFSCEGPEDIIETVTSGYCDGEGQYVECKGDAWADPDKCSEHNQVCSANGCRDGKDCDEDHKHGDKSCIENTKIYVCDDGTLKPEKVDGDGNAVPCPYHHECTPPDDNPKDVQCYPVVCVTNELACAGEQFQLCVNQKWDTPKDMPTGFNATCTGDEDEVPRCDSGSLTTNYCDGYVAMNCALYTETGKEGHVEWSKCGPGLECDLEHNTCTPKTCSEEDAVQCFGKYFQVCDGTAWSVPAELTPQMQDIVNCKQDNPDEPGILVCKAGVDLTKPKTACSHVIRDIQGNLVSLEINCTDHTASTPKTIEISTCGNSLECYNASTPTGTCGPEKCDSTEENKLRCSEDLKQICKDGIWTAIDTVISDIPADLLGCQDDGDDEDGDDEVICEKEGEHCVLLTGNTETLVLTCDASGEKATVGTACDGALFCDTTSHQCVTCINEQEEGTSHTKGCTDVLPGCKVDKTNPKNNACVQCSNSSHCTGNPNGDTCFTAENSTLANYECHQCDVGSVRCISGDEVGTVIENKGSYTITDADIGKINICNENHNWSILFAMPGDADTVFRCEDKKLKCNGSGTYCQAGTYITPDVALTCAGAGQDAKGDLACPGDPGICHKDRHICMRCTPGEIQCTGTQYRVCDAYGQWEAYNAIPSGVAECIDGKLQCANDNANYCDDKVKINCAMISGTPKVITEFTCHNNSDRCNEAHQCDETCVVGDARCVEDGYQICDSGTWSSTVPQNWATLPAGVKALLETAASCQDHLKCAINGSYCEEGLAASCYKAQPLLITSQCPDGTTCQSNKCQRNGSPNPDFTDDLLNPNRCDLDCAKDGKVCYRLPNGQPACWYEETFDYPSNGLSYESTTSLTNPVSFDLSNIQYNDGRLYTPIAEAFGIIQKKTPQENAPSAPGYKGYYSWNVKKETDPDVVLWRFAFHGTGIPNSAGPKNKLNTTDNYISLTSRGELECDFPKANELTEEDWNACRNLNPTRQEPSPSINGCWKDLDENVRPDQGRCWRNWFEISGFNGGVSMLAFKYKPFSSNNYGIMELLGDPTIYYHNHLKMRVYVNDKDGKDMDIPVAVFVPLVDIRNDGDATADVATHEIVIDFTRMTLPEGVDLKKVTKITVRPEYINLDGESSRPITMFGQTGFDDIRWLSAE